MTTSVLVIGLLPAQAQRVKRALPGLRLRFMCSEHARRLRSTPEVTVVAIDYVNHDTIDKIHSLLQSGQRMFKVRGIDKAVIARLKAEVPATVPKDPYQCQPSI